MTVQNAQDLNKPTMFEDAYFRVQRVLDRALGTREEDGSGEGIAEDVQLLMDQRDAARAEAAVLRGRIEVYEAVAKAAARRPSLRVGAP